MPLTVEITPSHPVIDAARIGDTLHVRFTFADVETGDVAKIVFTPEALTSFLTQVTALAELAG